MSALDQAFLKAYSKDKRAAATPPPRSAASTRRPDATRAKAAPEGTPGPSGSDPYVSGTWYRLEPAEGEVDVEEAAAEAEVASKSSRSRRRFGVRAPHVRFHSEPAAPEVAAPAATPVRAPKSYKVQPAPTRLPQPLPEPLSEIEAVDEVEPISPDVLSSLCTVTTTGSWDAPASFAPPVEAPRAPLPVAPFYAANPVEPAVTIKSYELAAEPVKAETAAPPAPSQVHTRFDAPAASAVSKPHFPLPIVAEKAPEPKLEVVVEKTIEPAAQPSAAPLPATEPPVAQPAIPAISAFEPAWEVERFAWPAVCDELLASALDDWGLAVRQLLAAAKQGCKTLAIAGLRRGEGRSTLALCLARLAAQTGAQIALVDADFENPKLAGLLGVGTECDWRTALADGLPLTEASIICLADQLTLIPLQHSVPFKQTSFGRPGVAAMLKSAASAFDLVLVDAGPIAGPEHAACWGGSACPLDGVLLVRDLRRTDAEEAAATVAHLRRTGRDRVVVLENFVGAQRS